MSERSKSAQLSIVELVLPHLHRGRLPDGQVNAQHAAWAQEIRDRFDGRNFKVI